MKGDDGGDDEKAEGKRGRLDSDVYVVLGDRNAVEYSMDWLSGINGDEDRDDSDDSGMLGEMEAPVSVE